MTLNMKRLLSAALFLLLVDSKTVKAEVYNTTRFGLIKTFEEKDIMVCLRPLSQNQGEDVVVARLIVKSTASSLIRTAGNSTLDKLIPKSWQKISIEHAIENQVHILNVKVDAQKIPFYKENNQMWITAYHFKEVELLSKGRVEIIECLPPEDTNTTTTVATDIADNEGWQFMYSLGNINGFPIVGLIIISAIVVIAICIFGIIMCKRRCRCCQENDQKKTREASYQFQRLDNRVEEVDKEFSLTSPHVSSVSFTSNRTPVFSKNTCAGPETSHVTLCETYSSPCELRRDMQRHDSQGYFNYNTQEIRSPQSPFLPIDQINQKNDSFNEFPEYMETIYTKFQVSS